MNDQDDSRIKVARVFQPLVSSTGASRALLWQFVGKSLMVTHELAAEGPTYFTEFRLSFDQSVALIQEYMVRFPDRSGLGAIVIDIADFMPRLRLFPELTELLKVGRVRWSMIAQCWWRESFKGFLEVQHPGGGTEWTSNDGELIQQSTRDICKILFEHWT